MKHVLYFVLCAASWFQLVACASATPTPAPVPPTNAAVPTQIAPTATHTATRIPATAAPTQTIAPQAVPSDTILDLTWSRDGKQIITTTGDKLQVYDAAQLDSFVTVTLPQEIFVVQSLPTELDLALGMRDTIRFIENRQERLLTRELRGGTGEPSSLTQSGDGRRIAAGFIGNNQGGLGNVALWDTASGQLVNTAPMYGPVTRVAFRKDGGALLIASAANSCARGGGGVSAWDYSGDPQLIFDTSGNSVADLALSPTENRAALITPHGDSRCLGPMQVQVWDIDSKKILESISFPQGASALAYSPDGKFLAIGTNDGAVHLTDAATYETVREFHAAPGAFVRLAFRPDGKALAAATQDTVQVWSVADP